MKRLYTVKPPREERSAKNVFPKFGNAVGKQDLLDQDEREFQIELASKQMRHKAKLITLFGVIVLEFSLFGVINGYLCLTFNPWLAVTTAAMTVIGLFTILFYFWDLQDIEKETRKLKEKYTWR
jgi:hypothetical protein